MKRHIRGHLKIGFLMVILGILTGTAWADVVDVAMDCLATLEEERASHMEKVIEAERLGLQIDDLRSEGAGVPDDLMRRAERLEQEALNREVDITTRRQLCRELSREALEQCRLRIRQLQSSLASGDVSPSDGAELLRLHDARSRMEAVLEEPITLSYAILPLDPSDTEETLQAKLQYYEDVQEYLEGLLARVDVRRAYVARERQMLAEAQRFLEDMSFLDEGGRLSPGGQVRLPGAGDVGGVDFARPAIRPGESGPASRELESLMALSPASPEESDQLLILLEQIHQMIEGEVEAVSKERERIEERLLLDVADPR